MMAGSHDAFRAQIEQAAAEFIANGGRVQEVPRGASAMHGGSRSENTMSEAEASMLAGISAEQIRRSFGVPKVKTYPVKLMTEYGVLCVKEPRYDRQEMEAWIAARKAAPPKRGRKKK